MDLSQVPEKDRQQMLELIEKKQADQFIRMYSSIIGNCFEDCIGDFTTKVLSGKEEACLKNCTAKFLNIANRMGQQMADEQMDAAAQISALQPEATKK